MLHQNSLFTYDNKIRKELTRRQAEVYHVFAEGGAFTDRQIARALDLSINQITGRIGELIKLKRIEQVGKITEDGRKCRVCKKVEPKIT